MRADVGDALREAREARGSTLAEVERDTKIRARYLRAIEEERWDDLPGRAAARGFVSTYSHYLGLDEERLVAAYMRRHGRTGEIERLPADVLPRRGTLPGRSRWPGAVVIVAAAAIVLSGLLIVALPGDPDETEPATVTGDPQAAQSGPGASGNRSHHGERSATADKRTDPAPEKASASKEEGGAMTIELRSRGEVWVCLTSDRGRALVEAETLGAGESRGPFQRRAFEAGFGNGSVVVRLDGERLDLPPSADPVGYRFAPRGVEELAEGERPECS